MYELLEKTGVTFAPGEEPEFKWIDKSLLRVDNTAKGYQRPLSEPWVQQNVGEFKWRNFGAIMVSQRGGLYYVIDAQHRLAMALLIPQIKKVPCLIYKHQTRTEEAQTFNAINKNRRSPRPLDGWRSDRCARKEVTLAAESCMREHGFEVGKASGPNSFKCPGDVIALQTQGRLDDVLRVLKAAWPDDVLRTKSCVVAGVGRFLSKFENHFNRKAALPEVIAVFSRHSLVGLKQRGYALANSFGSSGKVGFCEALVEKWNEGRRSKTNRIPFGLLDSIKSPQ